jgi:hypothetical protein
MWNVPEVVREIGVNEFRAASKQQPSHLDHRLLGVAGTVVKLGQPSPTDLALELLERRCWWLVLHGASKPLFARSGKPRALVAIVANHTYMLRMYETPHLGASRVVQVCGATMASAQTGNAAYLQCLDRPACGPHRASASHRTGKALRVSAAPFIETLWLLGLVTTLARREPRVHATFRVSGACGSGDACQNRHSDNGGKNYRLHDRSPGFSGSHYRESWCSHCTYGALRRGEQMLSRTGDEQ